jgi:hypothetical protein
MLEKPLGLSVGEPRSPLIQKHVVRRYISASFWGGVILLGFAFVGAYLPKFIGETASL